MIKCYTAVLLSMLPLAAMANYQYNPTQVAEFQKTGICQNCDLTKAVLEYSSFSNTNLHGSYLTQAVMDGSKLASADFSDTNMVDVVMGNSNLSGSNFTNSNMEYADMVASDFSRCDFSGADVKGANFTNTILIAANISSNQLASMKSLSCAIMPDGTQHPSDSGAPC